MVYGITTFSIPEPRHQGEIASRPPIGYGSGLFGIPRAMGSFPQALEVP